MLVTVVLGSSHLSPAHAAGLGSLQLAIEPGVSGLAPPFERRAFGYGGGLQAELGLGEQLRATVFGNRQTFPTRKPGVAVDVLGATLCYRLDDFRIAPTLELGVANVSVSVNRHGVPATSTVSVVGAGFEVVHFDWLLWGVVMRYYPLFGTDLLQAPAYATLHGRIGLALDWGK
ncbi:MAG: hypothetical protein HY903_15240 [Deltaproteobacteria bacterium]|nr:hypothetical protein [Deltaproteobacteria bacterium]